MHFRREGEGGGGRRLWVRDAEKEEREKRGEGRVREGEPERKRGGKREKGVGKRSEIRQGSQPSIRRGGEKEERPRRTAEGRLEERLQRKGRWKEKRKSERGGT